MATLAERFVQDLGRVSNLPSRPQVLTRLVAALGRDDVSLTDLADIVRQDAALAAQVLKIANSAAYGARVEVVSMLDGLMRIGLGQTRRLALALSLYNLVPRPEFFVHQSAFWRHSLGAANAAAVVVRRAAPDPADVDEETAYLMGLFHDVGLIALAGYYPREYAAVKAFAERSELPFYAAEAPILDTDHGQLGAILAESWGLPERIVEVIRTHHRLDRIPRELVRSVQILQVAEHLCQLAGLDELGEGWTAGVDASTFEDLGVAPDSLNDLVWETRGETERFEGLVACLR